MAEEQNNNEEGYPMIALKFEVNKTPTYSEEAGKDYIIYGADAGKWYNLYPDYLTYLYNSSGKHNALCNTRMKYVCGNGWEIEGAETMDPRLIELATAWGSNVNSRGENMSTIVKKCQLDRVIYGGFYMEVIWRADGKGFDLYHVPFKSYRRDKKGRGFWYSKNWGAYAQSKERTGLELIPNLNLNNRKGKQIYFYYDYRPSTEIYPMPAWHGGVAYVEIDCEIANFHLNAIKNGFMVGTIISLNNGKPSKKDLEANERRLKRKHTGTDNANSLLIMYAESKDNAPTIVRMQPDDYDKQYNILAQEVEQEIFVAHGVTNPQLHGIMVSGKLGGRTEMVEAYEIYKNTIITPDQLVLEEIFNKFAKLAGVPDQVKFKLKDMPPIKEKLSEAAMLQVLTKNEIREMYGFKAIIEQPQLPQMPQAPEQGGPQIPAQGQPMAPNVPSPDGAVKMSDQEYERVLKIFLGKGRKKDKLIHYVTKFSRPVDSAAQADQMEMEFMAFEDEYELSKKERDILVLISKNPKITIPDLAKAMKADEKEVNKMVKKLLVTDYLSVDKEGVYSVNGEIDENKSRFNPLEIFYHYDVLPYAGKKIIPTTRQFCKELIEADLYFSREEIDQISSEIGYDVFELRGGFWRIKNTDITLPHCRHRWVQVIARKKPI